MGRSDEESVLLPKSSYNSETYFHGLKLDREILAIAAPSLVALALDPVLASVDTAFIGQLPGPVPLAAMGVSASLFSLMFSSCNFFANAATPIVAGAKGERGEAAALSVGKEVIKLALLLGCIVLVGVQIFAPRLVAAFGVSGDKELANAAEVFMRLRALSSPAVVSITALNGALRGVGDATSALYAAALSTVINFFLDIFLIFGPPKLGQNGAAIATAAAEISAALFLSRQYFKRCQSHVISSDENSLDDRSSGSSAYVSSKMPFFIRAAGASIVRSLSLQLYLAGTTAYIGFFADSPAEALGTHQILKQLYVVLSFATDALAIAAQQLIASSMTSLSTQSPPASSHSEHYISSPNDVEIKGGKGRLSVEEETSGVDDDCRERGASSTSSRHIPRPRYVATRILLWGAALGLLFTLFLYFCGGGIITLMTTDDRIRHAAKVQLFAIVAPLQVLSSVVFVGDGVMQGSQDFFYEAKAMFVSVAIASSVLFLMGTNLGEITVNSLFGDKDNGVDHFQVHARMDALTACWISVVILQFCRAATFGWRFVVTGPLVTVKCSSDNSSQRF